jgi:serine O-acetyltransferase
VKAVEKTLRLENAPRFPLFHRHERPTRGCECMPEELLLEQNYLDVYKMFRELYRSLKNNGCKGDHELENNFFGQLPVIFDLLYKDAEAIFNGDPAARSLEEVVHIYPGFYAIFIYRVAHIFYSLGMPSFARMLSEYGHSITGIDIHPGAAIGHSFGIDHGTGIVIGETTVIGNNVKIYQGVTLGAKSVEKNLASIKRHPTIEDNVIIYSGATILGGQTIVGHHSIIGGNVFLTKSVIPYSMVYNRSEISIKAMQEEPDYLDIAV